MNKEFKPTMLRSYYITRHLLLQHLQPKFKLLSGRLLDFGCGSKPYKELIRVERYIGVDFLSEGHSHAGEDIDFLYDGKRLPFKSQCFDSMLSTQVFEHVPNLEKMLKEINRVMKNNALMVITCPFLCAEHEVPNDYNRYTSYGIQELLTRNGFCIIDYEKIGSSIQVQFQILMSYLDSYVLSKLNFIKPVKNIVSGLVFLLLNLLCYLLNAILPKRYDAFLNHLIVCIKIEPEPTIIYEHHSSLINELS